MRHHVKCALLAGAAWGVLAGASTAQDAEVAAQAANVDQANMVEDIVVTARRRDEQLKDVPVAVSALSEERLEQTGASDITALQQQTPNATVQVARGSNSTLISFIRGVGQQDPLWGFEPGVGLYVDDVYVARPQGAVLDIYDVQRIEVLRGPQGSL
ncbi:MAG: TonB-dependent receptor plug domain-containing protein, partial [Sphingomonas sp.]